MDLLADVLEMIRNENCPAAPPSVNYFLCPLVGVLQAGQWARNSDPTATLYESLPSLSTCTNTTDHQNENSKIEKNAPAKNPMVNVPN